ALHRTIWGRSVLAIGQNIRAARLAGVKVEPVRFATYALCGTLGGLDGALFLVPLLTMLNTFGVSAGVRLLLTGLIIVAVITAAGGEKRAP
ncbi:MAG: ABC transporter permease, partial [Hyphomicrobiales bacterium]|nr:ABC transporter permease [Hyphomicrobiales bacterium]